MQGGSTVSVVLNDGPRHRELASTAVHCSLHDTRQVIQPSPRGIQVRAQLYRALAFSKQQHDVPQSFHAVETLIQQPVGAVGRGSQQVTGEPLGFEY